MEKYTEQEFLEYVVKSLVTVKDKVTIDRTIDELGVLLTLNVAPEDLPRVIGKGGQTAKAIRLLLRVIGYIQKIRVNLKINIPEEVQLKKEYINKK